MPIGLRRSPRNTSAPSGTAEGRRDRVPPGVPERTRPNSRSNSKKNSTSPSGRSYGWLPVAAAAKPRSRRAAPAPAEGAIPDVRLATRYSMPGPVKIRLTETPQPPRILEPIELEFRKTAAPATLEAFAGRGRQGSWHYLQPHRAGRH